MTKYINPPDCSKETWLDKNANLFFVQDQALTDVPAGYSLVCLVDNGPFTAAAVVDSDRDFRDFNDPSDSRPKIWYCVANDKLQKVAG